MSTLWKVLVIVALLGAVYSFYLMYKNFSGK